MRPILSGADYERLGVIARAGAALDRTSSWNSVMRGGTKAVLRVEETVERCLGDYVEVYATGSDREKLADACRIPFGAALVIPLAEQRERTLPSDRRPLRSLRPAGRGSVKTVRRANTHDPV